MKCWIKGWFKDGPQEAVEISVNFMGEDYVWFEFTLKNGQKIQTLPLKGNV